MTLSDPARHELFSYPCAQVRISLASRTSFRVQHGDEGWWLSGTGFQTNKQFERVRQRIAPDDVALAVPRLADTDEDTYRRLMSDVNAQQQAWCGLWINALHQAGALVQ